MGTFWEPDGNKRILVGYCTEQEEFDLETVWELGGKSNPHPFKKIRNSPWGHV
jgi:hypothetical protein